MSGTGKLYSFDDFEKEPSRDHYLTGELTDKEKEQLSSLVKDYDDDTKEALEELISTWSDGTPYSTIQTVLYNEGHKFLPDTLSAYYRNAISPPMLDYCIRYDITRSKYKSPMETLTSPIISDLLAVLQACLFHLFKATNSIFKAFKESKGDTFEPSAIDFQKFSTVMSYLAPVQNEIMDIEAQVI